MTIDRRGIFKISGLAALAGVLPAAGPARAENPPTKSGPADYTIHIANGLLDLGPKQIISTTLYNGQFPGPLLRFKEGQKTTVDILNDTDSPEMLHWHGQKIPSEVDGAAEERSKVVPSHHSIRETFIPRPRGFRFYHSHVMAAADFSRGMYSGLVGPVYIEPKDNPGAYDREEFLVLKEFVPTLSRGGDMTPDFMAPAGPVASLKATGEAAMKASLDQGKPKGFETNYQFFSINGRMLGESDPIRVKPGERVLFHVLNGSATEIRSLALPGHTFRVLDLDGNPVPTPVDVPVLWLGPAERISAVVAMNHPGVWTMGDLSDDDRDHGMGIVVEYPGANGKPQWVKPPSFRWDYTSFGKPDANASAPDEVFDMVFAKNNAAANGFNRWTINGTAFAMARPDPMFHLTQGRRYRLRMHNVSDDIHPIHFHRHTFELTRIAGKPTAGVMKDVMMLGGYQEAEVDFVADNPGLSLFHCHTQLHMDFGFMALFDYPKSA